MNLKNSTSNVWIMCNILDIFNLRPQLHLVRTPPVVANCRCRLRPQSVKLAETSATWRLLRRGGQYNSMVSRRQLRAVLSTGSPSLFLSRWASYSMHDVLMQRKVVVFSVVHRQPGQYWHLSARRRGQT